ncbi:regulatory protein [Clostridioides difficile]|uniref:BlaI/MecI/CopY family transcriptional regulator n=1 Tax=Clostridioides difficile TaxID=1496 RepID=UPI00097FF58C|nr:BlaI/MecI/CopY family transcriptional regulator [Clostridioides difficile]SJV43935.1 regulatory protein [Clostridioides difficile]
MKEEILIEKLLRAELHKSTIKILLKRLVDKGYLARDIIKFQSHYKIIIDNEEYYAFKKKVLKSSKSRKIMRSLTTTHKNVSKEKLDSLEEYYKNLKE